MLIPMGCTTGNVSRETRGWLSFDCAAAVQVQALDAWGNATCPQDALPFEIRVQSEAADPDAASFAVDDRWVVECHPDVALVA
jgi:hypothetical protein